MKGIYLVWTLLLLAAVVGQAQTPLPQPLVELFVPQAPAPARASGQTHLVYEVHLTNFKPADVTLTRVEVFRDKSTQPLASYTDKELTDRLGRPGLPPNTPNKAVISGGMRAVIFLWLTTSHTDVPATLRHKLFFQSTNNTGASVEQIIEGAQVTVRQEAPMVIGPPLRGGMWVAANGPDNNSGHRRSMRPLDGKTRISQRFAYDWIRLNTEGRRVTGDQAKNESWAAHGAEVIAVADAVVTSIKDGIPENVPNSPAMAVPITLETITGNHVILDLGHRHFALYAHLQPNSLRVKVGNKVKRGQVLALLGNTGNSSEPHLHFQIMDASSAIGSEGLPFVFDSYEFLGTAPPSAIFGFEAWQPSGPAQQRQNEMPLSNAVVRFPESGNSRRAAFFSRSASVECCPTL